MTAFLFDKEETQFTNLGLGELPITKGEVTRERNGSFTLYAELPFGATLADKIEKEMRIKADAGARTKWQTFVINRTVKDTEHEVIKVYAEHITMMTMTDSLKPQVVAKDMDAQHALMVWNQNRLSDVQYDVGSDILTKGSTTWDVSKISNAREALGGKEGSILDVWGGEYEFDNNRIFLHKEMGRDTQTILEYGRNIQAMEYEELLDGVYTSVYPFAKYTENNEKDGSTNSKEIMVTLPEYYIDSPNAENYQNRRFQIVDFSSEFDTSGEHPEIPTPEKLRKLANSFIKNNDVGAPKIKQEVKYIDLAKTLDYEDMQFIEEIELCDRVPVFYPQLNVQANNVKVTETVFDIVNDQYETITVSTIGAVKSPSITSKLEQKLDNLSKNQSKVNKDIYYTMNQAGNRIWWVKPDDNIEHKIGDTYFEKNGKYNRIYRWDGENWILEYDSETFEKELSAKIAEAEAKAEALEKTLNDESKRVQSVLDGLGVQPLSQSHEAIVADIKKQFEAPLSNYVKKATYEQGIDGVNNTISQTNSDLSTFKNDYQETAKGFNQQLSTITNQADDLAIKYQDVKSTADLFTRTFGSDLNGIENSVSRIIQNSGLIQSEVKSTKDELIASDSQLNNKILANHQDLSTKISQSREAISLGLFNDREAISEVGITKDGVRINGELNHISGKTLIDNGVIKNAHIGDLNANKITAGTLNGNNVNIINLQAKNLVGQNSEFIQTSWNGIDNSMQIKKGELLSMAGDGSQVYLQNGLLGVRNTEGNSIGQIGYIPQGNTKSPVFRLRTTWGASFAINQTFYDSYTKSTKDKDVFRVNTGDDGKTDLQIRSQNVRLYNSASLSFENPGYNSHYITSERYRLSISGNESVSLRANESTIFVVSNSGGRSYSSLHANLNLQGNSITNQSDKRLKKDIKETKIKALEIIQQMPFRSFKWRTSGESVDLGLIAQETPYIGFYDDFSDIWSIDSSQQIMLNSKAIQELLKEVNSLKDEIKKLKGMLNNG
ncbi:MAG: gp58-like family protein [Aerococcus suis]|nr:gp58-like family protein [Aerococcus suis]